ncbi:hypothetical protein SAMN05421676_107175 [Salinibacillus kushneri]|uniref:Uncharacterized protein n=1 Tax=Salinibacillus kushneri TaxID=237682 RepID=A0A1I0GX90_9BACI|nr:hypothetical protein [Salinibacillus kushneri]SET74961.1 hypothetical protein SAMN05421676_107175 [Salinibacillus kushneri]
MKINLFLIQFATSLLVIFGGTFIFRYFRTGELLLFQLIGASVGVVLLIASLIWRKLNK